MRLSVTINFVRYIGAEGNTSRPFLHRIAGEYSNVLNIGNRSLQTILMSISQRRGVCSMQNIHHLAY